MWAAIIALASKILGIFFPDKSAETQGREAGEIAGKAEQKAADQGEVLNDVQAAKDASNSVDSDVARGVPVTESDGFRRD